LTHYPIIIIGAGLAGSEAAYQIARQGIPLALVEMRPQKQTAAHRSSGAAELVCSNSFRNNQVTSAVGVLKEEMRLLRSLIMEAAQHAQVPAGVALAVDRDVFSGYVTQKLSSFLNLTWVKDEVVDIIQEDSHLKISFQSGRTLTCNRVLIASGPLTSEPLAKSIFW